MNDEQLRNLLAAFQGKRVLVLGDVMLDEYIWGEVTRISPEAPVPVVEARRHTFVPGGATNVVNNIQALGGKAMVVGVVGEDEMGRRLIGTLSEVGVDVSGLIADPERPTTVKTRVIAHSQQVVRIDRESRDEIGKAISRKLVNHLAAIVPTVDAVLVSDYDKGVVCRSVVGPLLELANRSNRLVTANPKPHNILLLRGCGVVSVNQPEAEGVARMRISDEESLLKAGRAVLRELGCRALLITRGAKGISIFQEDGLVSHLPAAEIEVYDVAGAGDTVISATTLAMAAGAGVVEATALGNLAAGAVVRKVGVATTTCEEILSLYGKDSG